MIVKARRCLNVLLANSDGGNRRFSSEGLLLALYLRLTRALQIPGCFALPGTCRTRKSLNVFDNPSGHYLISKTNMKRTQLADRE